MPRAVQTAQVFASRCDVPHHLEPQLHERYVGIFSGKTHEEVAPFWKETVRRWSEGDADYHQDGAESLTAVRSAFYPSGNGLPVRTTAARSSSSPTATSSRSSN